MAGRYNKAKNKKTERLKRRIIKAQQGVMMSEEPSGGGGTEGAISSAGEYGKMGSRVGGPVGGMIGTGVGLAMHSRRNKQARKERESMRHRRAMYKKYGTSAENNFEQKWGEMAKKGKGNTKKKGVIEIEGKLGVGELHFDKNDNLKNVGSNPHSNGGDKVVAEVGDWVAPTQPKGKSKASKNKAEKEQGRILRLAEASVNGDKKAKSVLKKYKQKLPDGEAVAMFGGKYFGGAEFRNSPPDDFHLDGGYDEEDGLEETVDRKLTREKVSVWDKLFGNFEEKKARRKEAEERASKEMEKKGIKANEDKAPSEKVATKVVAENENPRFLQVGNGEMIPLKDSGYMGVYDPEASEIAPGIYLKDGLPVNEKGERVDTEYQKYRDESYDKPKKYGKGDKESFLEDVGSQKYNWTNAELQEAAASVGATYSDIKKTIMDHNPNVTEDMFGEGTTEREQNIGKLTTGLASANYNRGEDPLTGQIVEELPQKEFKPKEYGDGPDDEGHDKKFKPSRRNEFGRYSNVIGNMLDSLGPIEGYDETQLNLERNKYKDMSAPRMKEAYKHNMVRRANRQRLVGSKGQQVTQAAQDEVLAQEATDRILADEIMRHQQVINSNTAIANQENMFGAQEAIRGKDIRRAQRAAKRNLRRAANAELADISDVNQQREYMEHRNEKQDAMDVMMYKMMMKNASPYYTNYDTDPFNEDGTAKSTAGDLETKNEVKKAAIPKKKKYKYYQ